MINKIHVRFMCFLNQFLLSVSQRVACPFPPSPKKEPMEMLRNLYHGLGEKGNLGKGEKEEKESIIRKDTEPRIFPVSTTRWVGFWGFGERGIWGKRGKGIWGKRNSFIQISAVRQHVVFRGDQARRGQGRRKRSLLRRPQSTFEDWYCKPCLGVRI